MKTAMRGDELDDFLVDGGALIAAEYRGRSPVQIPKPIDEWLDELGYQVESVRSAIDPRYDEERVRVAVVRASS